MTYSVLENDKTQDQNAKEGSTHIQIDSSEPHSNPLERIIDSKFTS